MTEHRTKRSKGRRRSSSRRRRERDRNRKIVILLAVILVIVLIIVGAIVLLTGKSPGNAEKQEAAGLETSDENGEEEQEEQRGLQFPYELEDGKLVVDSLFQSSIANPDYNNELGENIASIELVNNSDQFLAHAQITMMLEDGTQLKFEVEDLPSGMSVLAFETDNMEIPMQPICESVVSETEYEEDTPLLADKVTIESNGTAVTVYNITNASLTDISVRFHCLFDENVYYGGKTYEYSIAEMPPGGNLGLEVTECYLGTAEAVRVTQK